MKIGKTRHEPHQVIGNKDIDDLEPEEVKSNLKNTENTTIGCNQNRKQVKFYCSNLSHLKGIIHPRLVYSLQSNHATQEMKTLTLGPRNIYPILS